MTAYQWLTAATKQLAAAGVSSARLDSLILLEDCLGHSRAQLLAHPEIEINDVQLNRLNRQLGRRARHVPLSYIRGFGEFYGRRFRVNRHVLTPRPEPETMIELLKDLAKSKKTAGKWVIADVGTGSGCLGITAALEFPGSQVDLYDIDASALAVARHNAELHELRLGVYKRDLLSRPARPYDVVLANLPYVPTNYPIDEGTSHEPKVAVYGGNDGLDFYRRLFSQLARAKQPPQYVLTETLPHQQPILIAIAENHGYELATTSNLTRLFVHIG